MTTPSTRRVVVDVSGAFLQRTGGMARYQRALVAALRSVTTDWTIELAADHAAQATAPAEFEGLPVHWLAGPPRVRRLRDLLSHYTPLTPSLGASDGGVFHATDFTAPRLRRMRTVVTVHDLTTMLFPALHQPLNRWHLRLAIPLACRQARRIICDSEATRRDLVRFLPDVGDRAKVVHLGVDPRFSPASAEGIADARRLYDLPGRYLLAVGTIEPRKGHATLIDVVQFLRTIDSNSPPIVIAGAVGWKSDAFLSALEASPARGLIRLIGPVPDEHLAALYSGAVAFVFPSLYEGWGFPVVEAMACGVPVVASRTAGVSEAVGDAGLLAPPHDARRFAQLLAPLVHSPDFRERLAARGRERARRFTWDETARLTAATYAEALA